MIGTVSAQNGFQSSRSETELYTQIVDSIQKKVFIVSSRIGAPYLMDAKPKNGEVLTGNDRYEGYSMDLIDGEFDLNFYPSSGYFIYFKNKLKNNTIHVIL